MATLKTRRTRASVQEFIEGVEDETRRRDAETLVELMRHVTGEEPVLWGKSIVGFGSYHYVYESGREGDWMLTGFSPRKQALSVYLMSGFDGQDELLEQLGPHRTGKSCLYITRPAAIDLAVLETLLRRSVETMKRNYGS